MLLRIRKLAWGGWCAGGSEESLWRVPPVWQTLKTKQLEKSSLKSPEKLVEERGTQVGEQVWKARGRKQGSTGELGGLERCRRVCQHE